MKKLVLLFVILTIPTSAFAAILVDEHIDGEWKHCVYSNGVVISIRAYQLCPLSI